MNRLGLVLLAGLLATVTVAGAAEAHTGVLFTYCSTGVELSPTPHAHVGGLVSLGPAGTIYYCVGIGG